MVCSTPLISKLWWNEIVAALGGGGGGDGFHIPIPDQNGVNSAWYRIYSRYRAIPAIDIDIRDISVGMLTSGPAASRAARHACMQWNRFIYLAEDSKHSMNFWHRYTEDQFLYFSVHVVLHRISLFSSARLLTLSPWISRCVHRQHTCICTVQRMQKSLFQHIRVLRSKILISIADIDRYRLYAIARIAPNIKPCP